MSEQWTNYRRGHRYFFTKDDRRVRGKDSLRTEATEICRYTKMAAEVKFVYAFVQLHYHPDSLQQSIRIRFNGAVVTSVLLTYNSTH